MSIFAQGTTLQVIKKEALRLWSRRPSRSACDCLFCGAWSLSTVCPPCALALPSGGGACPRCALPNPGGELCGACVAHPPPFVATLARFDYRFPVDRAIQRYKFAGDLASSDAARA